MLTSVLQARGVCAKLHLDRTAAGGVVLCSIRKMRQLARSGAGADLLVCQADRESSKVLLYRAAKAYGVPVVTGVRASIHEHQWKLCAKIYSYLDDPNLSCYDEVFHPEMSAVALRTSPRKCCAATTSRCDRETWIFKKIALEKPERNVSISPSALQERIETTPNYNKRHVCAVHANTAGCLVATLLIGGPEADIEMNLWEG